MSQNKTIEQLLIEGKNILKGNNISTWSLDAQVLLMYITKLTKVKLFSHNKDILSQQSCTRYIELIHKRAEGFPLQYIIGTQEFMSLDFKVNTYTLIPRSDTEVLVETILGLSKENTIKYIMDIGTGSGCIPISLLYYNNSIRAVAVDISEGALEVARENAVKHGVLDKIEFVNSDLFGNIPDTFVGKLDAIVSNPPYIPKDIIPTLMTEVREYEPMSALVGGVDGLDFYRKITSQGHKYIRQGGYLFYEIGHDQAEAVINIMKQYNFENIRVIKDLAGLDRVVIGLRA